MVDETNEPQIDFEALRAAMSAYARDVTAGFNLIGQALVDGMRPVVRQFSEALLGVVQVLRHRYEDAGAPYGPGDEAMWAWWHDLANAQRRQQAELQTRMREWMVADFRRQIHTPQLPALPVPQAQPLAQHVSPDMLAALKRIQGRKAE